MCSILLSDDYHLEQKLQKRAVPIITNSSYNAHTDPLFKKVDLLKVKDIFQLNVLKLYYSPYASGTLTKVRVSRHMICFVLCCASLE